MSSKKGRSGTKKKGHPRKHRRIKNLIKKRRYQKSTILETTSKRKFSTLEYNYTLSEEEIIKSYFRALKESINLYKKYPRIIMPQINRQSSELLKKLLDSDLPYKKIQKYEKDYKFLELELNSLGFYDN